MIWHCERRTMGLLATVRDRPVAGRDQRYAGTLPSGSPRRCSAVTKSRPGAAIFRQRPGPPAATHEG